MCFFCGQVSVANTNRLSYSSRASQGFPCIGALGELHRGPQHEIFLTHLIPGPLLTRRVGVLQTLWERLVWAHQTPDLPLI